MENFKIKMNMTDVRDDLLATYVVSDAGITAVNSLAEENILNREDLDRSFEKVMQHVAEMAEWFNEQGVDVSNPDVYYLKIVHHEAYDEIRYTAEDYLDYIKKVEEAGDPIIVGHLEGNPFGDQMNELGEKIKNAERAMVDELENFIDTEGAEEIMSYLPPYAGQYANVAA